KTQTSSMPKSLSRPLMRHSLFLVALAFTAASGLTSEGGTLMRRPIGMSAQSTIWQALGIAGQTASHEGLPPISTTITTVDTELYTGYENAIYAADDNTVYVAYKRFLSDPRVSGYIPAELRIAKSTDAGQTWNITVVDADAIEEGDTIDNSV